MRLWHEALLPYLPRQQLLGQHRECAALRGKGWGRKHATIDYVFTHPKEWLWMYHIKVMNEMINRGYHPDMKWALVQYQGEALPPREAGDIDLVNINEKLAAGGLIYPEHNDAYLEECLKNLEGKGINLRDDLKNGITVVSKPSN